MGGTTQLCLLLNISHSKTGPNTEKLCLLNDSSSPRVAMDELVLGPDGLIHKTIIGPTSLENLLYQPFRDFTKACHISNKKKKSEGLIELRHFRDFHEEKSTNQVRSFFNYCARRVRWTSVFSLFSRKMFYLSVH